MLELALAGEPGLRVDRRRTAPAGAVRPPSTLGELRRELGADAPIAWLVGADSLLELHTWHRWRELFTLAHLVAVQRPGSEVDAARLRAQAPEVLAEIDGRWLPPGRPGRESCRRLRPAGVAGVAAGIVHRAAPAHPRRR